MIHSFLGARSDMSLGESIIAVDDLATLADEAGADVVGLTETMSLSSLVEASKSLEKAGKRLVTGVRIRVIMREGKEEVASYFKLWPTNDAGVRSLFRLISRGFQEDRFYYVPRVTWDDVAQLVDDDCLALSTGDADSVVQREDMRGALDDLLMRKRFAAVFYELVPCTSPYWSRHNYLAAYWGRGAYTPIVIMPAMWSDGNVEAFSINAGIADKRPYEDYLRPVSNYQPMTRIEFAKAAVAAANAVEQRYPHFVIKGYVAAGLENTQRLVDLCKYKWGKLDPSLPVIAADPDEALKDLCRKGWGERFTTTIFDHQPSKTDLANEYLPRLQFELDTLKRLGFAQYFLLVADLVRWSKSQGIRVGPGRGSVGGSLVAYLTGITDVDPIRFNLLFERFINPDRLDLPDADLDFMSTRREEVIAYLSQRWGEANVAGIVNYNTMGARGAIRDVARIFALPLDQLGATKFIGDTHGVSASLEEAHEDSHEIQEFARRHPRVWRNALALEGKMRAFGTHAGGVVVAGEPLTERAVVERRGGNRVINWDKRVSEDQGLIKLDVLGLTTLDLMDHALHLIFRRHSLKLNIDNLSLDDPETLDIFNEARTAGVFQFEGGSVRRLLKEMAKSKPLTFEDLVALNALNRPGPLDAGITESYVRRRAGQEAITYPHPSLVPILEDTFGVIAYQEQVMQVSRTLCGYTPGEADTLRKIMGKKLPAEMAKQRDKFVDGAVSLSGMDPAAADRLFTDIEGFAGYAFNRSHAVEYTLIAYQAAYLKAHYLVEFYCSSMSIAGDDTLAKLVKQAAQDGIRVIPPDINISTHTFEALNDNIIAAPLSAVKGVSANAANAIVAERQNTEPTIVEESSGRGKNKVTTTRTFGPGPFKSIEDFRMRIPPKRVNAAGLAALDKVGAFARVEPGQPRSIDPCRQRDQIELMPALADQGVTATREVTFDDMTVEGVIALEEEMTAALGGQPVPCHIGAKPKMMIVLDAPFNDYEEITRQYSYKEFVAPALHEAGLCVDDALWSWVLRRPLRKGERDTPAAEVAKHIGFLKREIAITKPPVIVLLGPMAIRSFFPDMKQLGDAVGHKAYSADLDASVIVGFKPTQLYHDPNKKDALVEVFRSAAELVNN